MVLFLIFFFFCAEFGAAWRDDCFFSPFCRVFVYTRLLHPSPGGWYHAAVSNALVSCVAEVGLRRERPTKKY